jgi:hypothetical protein
VGRADEMVESGRLTEQEAERLRGADGPGDFDDVVRDVRVRHARASLEAAVLDGRLTPKEADRFLERLRNAEDPRSVRAVLRQLRQGDLSPAPGPGLARRGDDAPEDSGA